MYVIETSYQRANADSGLIVVLWIWSLLPDSSRRNVASTRASCRPTTSLWTSQKPLILSTDPHYRKSWEKSVAQLALLTSSGPFTRACRHGSLKVESSPRTLMF